MVTLASEGILQIRRLSALLAGGGLLSLPLKMMEQDGRSGTRL